ncbi:MAG: hypothetical protein OHK0022_05880 [Roseiflexaceae bacterium]
MAKRHLSERLLPSKARPQAGSASGSALARLLSHRLVPHFETLRPIGGFYLLILGASFLLLPEGQLGVRLQPLWLPAICVFVGGLANLWLSVVTLPRRISIPVTALATLPVLGIAVAYLVIGAVPPGATLGFLALGLLLAPFTAPLRPDDPPRPDALGLVFGGAAVVQGAGFLITPESATSLIERLHISYLPLGLLVLGGGCAVILTQLLPVPATLRWLAHGVCGLTTIGLQLAVAAFVQPLYWMLGAAAFLRGGSVLLLPWLGPRAAAFDRSAFRPRVALALLTASVLPVGVALPVVLATLPELTPEIARARQVAFGVTLLVMLVASVGGWFLAGSLTAPLTRLMSGVNQIAEGRRAAPLPQQGVTELAALSQAVDQMARSLQARAEEREHLLEREQQARAEAQEAVRTRDAFLSIAAHELKNPLTVLLGNAEMVARRASQTGATSERDQHALANMVDQAKRLNRLITLLLDVSQLETGQLRLTQERLDLAALVRRATGESASNLSTHQLVCQIPDTQIMIRGDELRLQQVFENLISNAVKYSPAGSVVTIELGTRDQQAVVTVRDQGIGIPADALPRLFQRFFRARNAEDQPVKGIGVGLYVVREIVSLHGGSITVQSQEGAGSTFTVCLPLET